MAQAIAFFHIMSAPAHWPCVTNSSFPVCPPLGKACAHHDTVLAFASRPLTGTTQKHTASVIGHAASNVLHVGARRPIPPCRAPASHSPLASIFLQITVPSPKTISNLDTLEKMMCFQNPILLRYPNCGVKWGHGRLRQVRRGGSGQACVQQVGRRRFNPESRSCHVSCPDVARIASCQAASLGRKAGNPCVQDPCGHEGIRLHSSASLEA